MKEQTEFYEAQIQHLKYSIKQNQKLSSAATLNASKSESAKTVQSIEKS